MWDELEPNHMQERGTVQHGSKPFNFVHTYSSVHYRAIHDPFCGCMYFFSPSVLIFNISHV